MTEETMTSRERVRRSLTFSNPDRAPRQLWNLPAISMFYNDQLQEVLSRFPPDFGRPDFTYGQGFLVSGTPNVVGAYRDEWGCVWHAAEPGVIGEVKAPPLIDWSALNHFKPPYEILQNADLSRVNASLANSTLWMNGGTTIRPFERLQFLRGTENLLMDMAWGSAEFFRLRDMVHEFFLTELQMWLKTDVCGISFMDDWGSQQSLLISPKMWREYFKPLYAEYSRLAHAAGKFMFMHSDGNIFSIYPDLIEIGINAVNSQLFCMDIEEIARLYRGKITFWGEIDRTWVLSRGSVEDVRAAVRRVRSALDDNRGGVIAQCEWGPGMPRENIETVFETWLE
jgi:hypothetical protein